LLIVDRKGEQEYSLSEAIATVSAYFHISEEMLKTAGKARPMTDDAKAVSAAIVQTAPHHRLSDLTKLLGRDISALGKAALRVVNIRNSNPIGFPTY